MKRLALIGSKDFALGIKEDCERWNLYDVVGFFDDYAEKGSFVKGLPILGTVEECISAFKEGIFDCAFIAIGYKAFAARERVYNLLNGKVPLASIISPNAIIHPTAIIGKGVLISDGVIVHKHSVIEDNVSITLQSIVNHGCCVKKHTFFSTGVVTAGNVTIGERCFIGVGSVLSDGVMVCSDVWLSPGSIVIKSLKKPGQYLSMSAKLVCVG